MHAPAVTPGEAADTRSARKLLTRTNTLVGAFATPSSFAPGGCAIFGEVGVISNLHSTTPYSMTGGFVRAAVERQIFGQ